jgi:hypothetical protein
LPSRCFDDCRFAYASSIKVDVGSLFRRLSFNVEVEELNNISDEVG